MSIRIENLSHSYHPGTPFEKITLRNITLDIETGACVGIAGRSGSGKTTLIQHMNGLLKPATGRILVDGADNLAELRRQVGVLFQYPEQQLFGETVFKDIAFGLSNNGMGRSETELRVREAMTVVGLDEALLERSPFTLSGGQQRRVAIAGVLVMRPRILVLDEPAAGLDPQGRSELMAFFGKLRQETGITLLLASHTLDDIVRLADRVVILNHGTVPAEGKTREVIRDMRLLEIAGLTAPPITCFMNRLKQMLPEIDDCLLTVEEARDELMRLWNLERRKGGIC